MSTPVPPAMTATREALGTTKAPLTLGGAGTGAFSIRRGGVRAGKVRVPKNDTI